MEVFKITISLIDGSLYFSDEEAQKKFIMDDKPSITGKQEVRK
ncbi:hypothetical protein [Clostridium peptidivorans]|nr:hypothetical protein [Clostridium peptidivorans]